MIKDEIRKSLSTKIKDITLLNTFLDSYYNILASYFNNNPQQQLQNVGLFVESTLRIAEMLIFGKFFPIKKNLRIDDTIKKLENASGDDNLRIHIPRMCRCIYDFRTRKTSVHLKEILPDQIDAQFVYQTIVWIMIEILYQCDKISSKNPIIALTQIKFPIVQNINGNLMTTNPILSGPERVLILLNSANNLTQEQLFEGCKPKIKIKSHLNKTLNRLLDDECIVKNEDESWSLRMYGNRKVIDIISKIAD